VLSQKHGLKIIPRHTTSFTPILQSPGVDKKQLATGLILGSDTAENARQIAQFSQKDAQVGGLYNVVTIHLIHSSMTTSLRSLLRALQRLACKNTSTYTKCVREEADVQMKCSLTVLLQYFTDFATMAPRP